MTAVFLPLALIAALGAFLRHVVAGMEERRQAMNMLVLYVLLPALVFQTVMDAKLDRLFIEVPIVAAAGVLACLAAAFVVFHFLPIPGPTKGAMMLVDEFRAHALLEGLANPRETSGGSAANTMAGLASLKGKGFFIGKVKDDRLGVSFAEDLRRAGCDFKTPMAKEGSSTAFCAIAVTPDGQRSMSTYLGACR